MEGVLEEQEEVDVLSMRAGEDVETMAARLDREDALKNMRREFVIPSKRAVIAASELGHAIPTDRSESTSSLDTSAANDDDDDEDGEEKAVYLCGNSLGLMSRRVRARVERHLSQWGALGVLGHFSGREPWVCIEDIGSSTHAQSLVGAKYPHEIVFMNSLTVNLHLMLTAFFRPMQHKHAILIEQDAFPSDHHAIYSHVLSRGLDPTTSIILAPSITPNDNSGILDDDALVHLIESNAHKLALVLLPGVQYLSGTVLPIQRLAATCNRLSIPLGLDLAHAVANIPLHLHSWGVDFAVWCSYKYLNCGPGAVGGAFLHHKHAFRAADDLPRLAGWWGHQRDSRFLMKPQFVPQPGVLGFQLSNPPVLAIVPIAESLEQIARAGGVDALRAKSKLLSRWFLLLLRVENVTGVQILTPLEDERHGCQFSIRLLRLVDGVDDSHGERSRDSVVRVGVVNKLLASDGIVCDTREPDVLRVAPAPLYNSFTDVLRFVQSLKRILASLNNKTNATGTAATRVAHD